MPDKNFSSKGSFRKLQNELKKSFEETIKKASTEAFDDVEIEGEVDGKKVKVKGSAIKNEVQKQLEKNLEEVTISPTVNIDPEFKVDKGSQKKIESVLEGLERSFDFTSFKSNPQLDLDFDHNVKAAEKLKEALEELKKINPNLGIDALLQTAKDNFDNVSASAKSFEDTLKEVRKGTGKWSLNKMLNDTEAFAKELNDLSEQYDAFIKNDGYDKKVALNMEARIQSMLAIMDQIWRMPSDKRDPFMPYIEGINKRLSETASRVQDQMWDAMANGGNLTSKKELRWLVGNTLDMTANELVSDYDVDKAKQLYEILQKASEILSYGPGGAGQAAFFEKAIADSIETAEQLSNRLRNTSEKDRESDPEWTENQYEYIAKYLQQAEEYKAKLAEIKGELYEVQQFTAESIKESFWVDQAKDIQTENNAAEEVLETFKKIKAYLDGIESDEHADLYGFQDLKGKDFNAIFNAFKNFDFDLLKEIGFSEEEINESRVAFERIIAEVKETQSLGRKVKNQDKWDAYESEFGQPPEVRVIDLADDWLNVIDKLINKIQELGSTEKEVLTVSPTQEFDNDVQRNIVFLENYKNTIKEIDRLKLQPETDETKKKLEELNNLAQYFVSNISAIRSENGDTVSAEMMQFGGTWAPNLISRYSNDQLKELQKIAHDNAGLATNKPLPEFQYIEDELKAIESQSESTRQSLTQDLVDSKKYAQNLANQLEELVGAREELSKPHINARDKETFTKELESIPKQYPEIAKISEQFATWDDALKFTASDGWLDFLATLPQAHKYLESIGYDFERVNKESLGRGISSEVTDEVKEETQAHRDNADAIEQETKAQEENTKAARKRLTEQARYYLNKATEGKIDYSETEAQFNRIISEMQQLGESTAHVEEQFAKAKAAFNMDGVAEGAEKGAEKVEAEAKSFSENAEKAQEAAQAKGKFNEANKETQQEADKSTDKVKEETEAVDEATLAFDGYYKNQHNKVGDDSWGYTERIGYAQDKFVNISHDQNGNIRVSEELRTNYQLLEKEIKKVTEAAVTLKGKTDEFSRKGVDTSASRRQLEQLGSYLHELNEELQNYYNSAEYIPGSHQKETFAQELKDAISFQKDSIEQKVAAQAKTVGVKSDLDALKASDSLYDKLKKNIKEVYNLKKKNASFDADSAKDQTQQKANNDKINSLLLEQSEIRKEILAADATQISREEEITKLHKEQNAELNAAIQKNAGDQYDKLFSGVGTYLNKINQVNIGKATQQYKDQFKPWAKDLETIKSKLEQIKSNGLDVLDPTQIYNLVTAFNVLKDSIDDALGEKSLSKNKEAAQSSLNKLKKSIDDIEMRNSAMGASFRAEFENLRLKIDTADSNEEVEKLKAQIIDLESRLIRSGKTGKSVFQQFGEAVRTSSRQFLAQYFSLQDFIRYAREGFDTVVQVDSALTELRKVSDASDERLAMNFEKSTETAKELGSTISDVIGVTADWARLGYDVDAAEDLARVTTLFQTVGDNMTAEETSSYLISTLQGFQMATSQAEEIADKYNEVANNFAIDTKGIGEALQRSAASFNAANTDLSEAIALVTTTNTVVQDPSSVGTLWKTMSARVRGAKAELIELGEEEDTIIESTSKLRDMVKGMTGFDIMEDEDTFKSIYDIILGIGKEWDKLSDIDQAALGEALAGKRNANALFAVLNNIETLEKAYATAEDAQGSAQREQENYAKSIEYSIGRMKAAAQEFWATFIESGTAKKAVDLLTNLLNLLTDITKATHGIATVGGVGLLGLLGHKPELIESMFATIADKLGLITPLSNQTAGGFAKLGASINVTKTAVLTLIKSPLAPWVAGAAIAVTALAVAWDKMTTTVSEVQSELDKTSGKISTLKSEIKELQDIDYRTNEQEKRLENLEKELEFQEKIYNIEQKRLIKEKYGSKFEDYFDKDNYNSQLLAETNRQNPNSIYRQFDLINKYQKKLDHKSQLKSGYESWLNSGDLTPEEIEAYNLQINDLSSEIDELNGKNLSIVDELRDKADDFKAIIEEGQEALDNGLVVGSDKVDVQNTINEYQKLYDAIHEKIDPILKENGLFDYSSTINSVFEHVEFDGLKNKLVDMAKEGSLSIDSLTNYINGKDGLSEALEAAGVDVEDLYKYILQLSGLIDRENLVRKIAGSNDYFDDRGFKTKAGEISDYISSLTEEEVQIVAGLDIDWSTFNADQAIAKMQAEIKKAHGNPVEVDVEFNVSKFNEQDNDLESLQSLYDSFRENVEGDTITVPLDISDVEELREKWESIVGKEAFDEFEIKVTTDNASVADVQKAFDTMATNYARNMIKIQGATKETMDMVKSQMKLDGLESEGVDKFVDSVVAEDKMQSFVSTLEEAQDAQGNMADGAVAAATDIYEEAKALGITDEMLIDYLKQAALAGNIVLGGDTSWLDLLAEKLGMDIDLLKELLGLANQGSGFVTDSSGTVHSVYGGAEGDAYLKRQEQEAKKRELENKYRNVNYTPSKKEASSAGGEAGDAYVEAYEKELQQLDDLKSQGLISEREYLDRLKALIDKYFKGRAEYAEKYAQELQKYMDQMLTHYNSVISGATTLLDHRIDQVSKQKETIISSLEEEKEAAEEAYQAQIDAIQEEIDALDDLIEAKQEEIDGLNDQIDAINEANEARDRSINLQKAEYELQRQMHQRTKLVYTGEVGQMRYERDESGVRDAQENLKDAQDEIAIAAIEKQIKLIEDEIEAIEKQKKALQDQQEELQKAMEATSKYYEKLIKEQEKMFDDMIEALENTKSKWEELAEVDQIASAWGLVSDEMQRLGFTIDDVLNGNDAAFEAFKDQYINHLAAMHSGDQGYLDGLRNTVGQIPGEFEKVNSAASQAKEPIDSLGNSAGTATGKVSSFGTAAGNAATGVGALKTASEGIDENLNKVQNVDFTNLSTKLSAINQDLTDIINKIGGAGLAGTLVGALESMNGITFEGLINSFSTLKSTISGVVSLLAGGEGDLTSVGSQSASMSEGSGAETGTGGGIPGALTAIQETAAQTIGVGGGEEGSTESDGTVVGDFAALNGNIAAATTAIGTTESEADQGDLIGAIVSLGEKDSEVLRGGENGSGVISDWNDFNLELSEAEEHVTKLVEGLENLADSYETEITVHLSIDETKYTGTASTSKGSGEWDLDVFEVMGLPNKSGDWISHLKSNAKGTAKIPARFAGEWGYHGGKTLIAELGPELVVFPDGHAQTFDRPQIVDLPKGSVIFNHLQSQEILDPNNQIKAGKAHAAGSALPFGFTPLTEDSTIEKIRAKIAEVGLPTIDGIKNALQEQTDAIRSEVRNAVSNNSSTETTVNQHNTFNISGVSGEDVARQINTTLVNTFSGMSLNAYQRSMA